MRLLAESTPENPNTVRILFYGQSITEQAWTKKVSEDLRKRFPHADLQIENRAIGGFSSQFLVKTAETDLYPFYPDLMIFHVYGAHNTYEDIIRRTRERTTAEIVIQTDHLSAAQSVDEVTDLAKLNPAETWSQWFNYRFLPDVAKRYQAGLIDQRNIWKAYLREHGLEPQALLKDGVHLNAHGEDLMARIVSAYLIRNEAHPAPAEDWIRTVPVTEEMWEGDALALKFEGNRVDAIFAPDAPTSATPIQVQVDGKAPSEFPGCYALSRTTYYPGTIWPCLLQVHPDPGQVPNLEEWTLTLTEVSEDQKFCKFQLSGSVTGPDGAGTSDASFVSDSGRVTIEPEDWHLARPMEAIKKGPLPDAFQVQWKELPLSADEVAPPPTAESNPRAERVATLAQSLPNGPHTFQFKRPDSGIPIAALRIYKPGLAVDHSN